MTNSFFASLSVKLEPLPDGRRWMLLEPFWFHLMMKGISCKITVSAGFITDFASVPRPFWNLIPPWGKHGKAAILHDWLYYKPDGRTRAFCDRILLEALHALGVRWLRRRIMYRAVRLCGWAAWRKHRRLQGP